MKLAFNPAQTRSLANAIQLGHGLNNVQGNIDDGLLPSERGDPSSDDPIRALVLELIRHADDGAVIFVQRDGAESQEMDGLGKDGGFFDAVARLVAGKYGRNYHAS